MDKKFIKFIIIGVTTTIIYTFFIWLLIEKLKYSSLIITPILTIIFFIGKYLVFDKWVFKK